MLEAFREWSPRADTLDIIDHANEIIAEYDAQGFQLTLRQLYYQFVARDLLLNSDRSYKRLGSIINDARMAGLVSWDAIEDRLRNRVTHSSWTSPASILRSAARSYQIDPWIDQESYVEVWIEKDALVGVIEPTCEKWRVPYIACRGYMSQSEQYAAGKRFLEQSYDGKECTVIHLGDHDPSGIDMTRDNRDRLDLFSEGNITVHRIALNMHQVEELRPPPNPAKITDSRAEGYIKKFGQSSWELDALEPRYIADLLDRTIDGYVDPEIWDTSIEKEEEARDRLLDYVHQEEDRAKHEF